MTTRAEIETALSSIDGVTGSEFRPSVLSPGVAWGQPAFLERADGDAFMRTWWVWVVLPQEERAASIWFDSHIGVVTDALEPFMFVDRVEPATIPVDNGQLFAILVTGRSE